MTDSIALHIHLNPAKPWSEIAISWLSDEGCDAFEETETGLIAYTDTEKIKNISDLRLRIEKWADEEEVEATVEVEIIPHQNWNALWESDFKAVNVEGKLEIIAPFHERSDNLKRTIVIQPQMSFGTGHHQTTWMMSKAILELKEMPTAVLDMGTGTGILAILAEQEGAQEILAIDIEEWSAENARENALRNNCSKIETIWGDIDQIEGRKFGLILANINKNVLKNHLPSYKEALLTQGSLIISGFFETDVPEMENIAQDLGFVTEKIFRKETWAAIQLQLNNDEYDKI